MLTESTKSLTIPSGFDAEEIDSWVWNDRVISDIYDVKNQRYLVTVVNESGEYRFLRFWIFNGKTQVSVDVTCSDLEEFFRQVLASL